MKPPASKSFTFTVPWNALCSDNRKFVSRQFVLTSEYRESKKLIGQFALAAARKIKWEKADGPVAIEAVVREPDGRRRDLNWSKNCKDGISACEGIWWDDSQVRWELWRFVEPHDRDKAGATITITALDSFHQQPHTDLYADAATVGRSRIIRDEDAEGLQREGSIRGGATAADEPTGARDGGAPDGRRQQRTPRQRSTSRSVTRGKK